MLFEVRNLTKRYAGLTAVNDLSYAVSAGEIVGLIGPNGSGKSTSIDCVSGFQKPDAGSWLLEGKPLQALSPREISLLGVTRTFQTVRTYDTMTLEQNLLTASQASDGVGGWASLFHSSASRTAEARARERAKDLLGLVRLQEYREAPAAILSYGQKKLLAIAAAIMARPRLVILDEPVAGVNPTMVNRIAEAIHKIRAEGVTLIVVEHNVDFIMAICDRIVVMETGSKIADGPPQMIHTDERVLAAYLGRRPAEARTHV